MQKITTNLKSTSVGDTCFGFELIKKEFVTSKSACFYTLKHIKTGAELVYFDRADENKTFAISFKTLPEDNTGVFHILEHSVLNGSEKFPVKEPFVSMLQNSMQTFLNAMTFGDKTMYPISSRNEQDFFGLMKVYLDAVFCPLIYKKPEIFMQEGWHYEFENENSTPYYNGVVYSEMKGVFADVDSLMEDETNRLLFKDNCYGYISGGHPDHITDLTYEQFINTHKRFYHPSNSQIFLDGNMDIDKVLQYINDEYFSKYTYTKPDFDFKKQTPTAFEDTVFYEAKKEETSLPHMVMAKILCSHNDTEEIYAAKILADYLTGSNEAPLTRLFLEKGLAQDINLSVIDGIYQPYISLTFRNTDKENFEKIKKLLPEAIASLLKSGLDKAALSASLEHFAFSAKEIKEPYGVELAIKAMESWLYGSNPLTHIDNFGVFEFLRLKLNTNYFENLLSKMLVDTEYNSYLYVLPSLTKSTEDAQKEQNKILKATNHWKENEKKQAFESFVKMQNWQQSSDTEENLNTLPRLNLKDIPKKTKATETKLSVIDGCKVLKINTNTNSIIYLNLFFDVSDFSDEELKMLSVLTACFGELGTKNYSANVIQTKIKANLGAISAKIDLISPQGTINSCKPYLLVSAAMLEENAAKAVNLIKELLINGLYTETERINEIVFQSNYFLKQSVISSGHIYSITKALSAFSAEGSLKEQLEGESFVKWFSAFTEIFMKNSDFYSKELTRLSTKAFSENRLFIGCSDNLDSNILEDLLKALPVNTIDLPVVHPVADKNACSIEIPSGVRFSAMGHNLYAMGKEYSGSCAVLSSLITFSYLWNAVRVQGGAYGTGMSIRSNGDIFCYSFRDPNLKNSKAAYLEIPEFLKETVSQGVLLDDIIIGTVNTTDPLLDPAGICLSESLKYLKGFTYEKLLKIRKEILETTEKDLLNLAEVLNCYVSDGKLCVVGDKNSVDFIK